MTLDLRSRPLERPLDPQPVAHPAVAALVSAAGLFLAFFVGRDRAPAWRLGRVLAIATLTALAVVALRRLHGRGCGRLAVAAGTVGTVSGIGFLPYLVKGGDPVTSTVAAGATVAGLLLLGAGAVLIGQGKRRVCRVATTVGTVLAAAFVAWTLTPSIVATNVPRPAIGASPAARGLPFEPVSLRTADGLGLAAWYVPSTNGAAVVLRHGAGSTRSNVLDHAAVLARHGFGVLLEDARGHGQSQGRAMDFGWYGDADIEAATRFLVARPDVNRNRIGAVGMSMAGEEVIGASGSNRTLRAVVAEGATARSARDEAWYSDQYGWRGAVQEQLEWAHDRLTDVLTSASVPISLRSAVEASGDTRYLLITAGKVPEEGHAASLIASGAPDRVEIWTVPGAAHTDGLKTAPDEWERRVTAFLSAALLAR